MMPLQLETIDIVIVLLSLVAAAAAGVFTRAGKNADASFADVALAGRRLTLPLFVITLVATWYGAVLGVGEFVHQYGIVVLLCFGVPYYLAAIIYAVSIAPRIRQTLGTTIPERIADTYGRSAGRVAAVLVFIVTSPAPYVLMAGELLHAVTGWDVTLATIVITTISMGYVIKGGLRSDVAANVVQIVLMYAGFALLLFYAMQQFGGIGTLVASQTQRLDVPGTLGWSGILAWWIIALQTFIDPNFHQRAAAAVTPTTARRGILVSVLCWMVFDILTITTALYAVTYVDVPRPIDAHLYLAQAVLPPVAKGIFVGGIFAAILSTLDGYAIVHGMTVGRDIIDAWRGRSATVASFRIGIVIAGIAAVIMSIALPSVIGLFMSLAGYTVPGLLMPLVLSYSRYAPLLVGGAAMRMVVPSVAVIAADALTDVALPTAMLAALVMSACWHLGVIYRRKGRP